MISYFVQLVVRAADGEEYLIKIYETYEKAIAQEKLDAFRRGEPDEKVRRFLAENDPADTLWITFNQYEWDEEGDIPVSTQLLDTFQWVR